MTTIAYRDGVMAADTCMTNSGGTRYASVRKIHRCSDGSLMGGAGDFCAVLAIWAWYDRGCPADDQPELPTDDDSISCVLIARPDGTMAYVEGDLKECPIEGDFHAIGSGVEGALCAMAAGASAAAAVEIVSRFDIFTNGPFITESLHPEETARIAGWHP